jgi:hypothetical protein
MKLEAWERLLLPCRGTCLSYEKGNRRTPNRGERSRTDTKHRYLPSRSPLLGKA